MFQNPKVPAQDQDQTNEQEQQKTNSDSIKIEQIESGIADGIYCQTYKHDQYLTMENPEQKKQQIKLSIQDFKVAPMMMANILNGYKVIGYSSNQVNKAQNSIAKILKEE